MGIEEKNLSSICDVCAFGIEEVIKQGTEMMDKYGWIAHYVLDEPDAPYNINYHTHGLPFSFKHKDLQVCFPLGFKMIHHIVTGLVEKIKAGQTFAADERVFDIIENYAITFMDARENDRDVLRVIFPDKAGCLDKNDMEEALSHQWCGGK